MTRYSLSVLKVPINTNQPTHQEVKRSRGQNNSKVTVLEQTFKRSISDAAFTFACFSPMKMSQVCAVAPAAD